MDKLVETKRERFWNREAWVRDQWVKAQADRLAPGCRVLDAGSGSSKYRPFFAHCRYETQDFCQYQGELVKYLQPIDHVCDITAVPLPDASLDAILCIEVLEHVVDPMSALKEFSRLLKPGGRLLLTAPQGSALHMEPYHYYGGFTHYWYRHWLPKYGFRVCEIVPQSGPCRAAVIGMQGSYQNWHRWETRLSPVKRWTSKACRMLFKLPVHYILPWMALKLDPHLDSNQLCQGFMVSAERAG